MLHKYFSCWGNWESIDYGENIPILRLQIMFLSLSERLSKRILLEGILKVLQNWSIYIQPWLSWQDLNRNLMTWTELVLRLFLTTLQKVNRKGILWIYVLPIWKGWLNIWDGQTKIPLPLIGYLEFKQNFQVQKTWICEVHTKFSEQKILNLWRRFNQNLSTLKFRNIS